MRHNVLLVFVVVVCALAAIVQGQEAGQQQGSFPGTSSSTGMETQGIRNYLLGPGDVLDIRIFGQPDLNSNAQIDSEGNLSSLPFLEKPIPTKCRTEMQSQTDIAAT